MSIDPAKHTFTPDQIDLAEVFIDVFPMIREPSGDSRMVQGLEEPAFYDVMLRPHDWDITQNEPYGEWENLTLGQANTIVEALEALNPGIEVNWVES
jgi:hypothetical protein